MLRPEQGDVGSDGRVGAVEVEEFLHPGPCIREQNVVDELDGRCRALDVQQNRADRRVETQRDSGT
jgi:hypothetical protein